MQGACAPAFRLCVFVSRSLCLSLSLSLSVCLSLPPSLSVCLSVCLSLFFFLATLFLLQWQRLWEAGRRPRSAPKDSYSSAARW